MKQIVEKDLVVAGEEQARTAPLQYERPQLLGKNRVDQITTLQPCSTHPQPVPGQNCGP